MSFFIASIGADASSSGATPCAACAMSRSARGLPSSPQTRSDTTTANAAPSCSALVLPGVSVPSGGDEGRELRQVLEVGLDRALVARLLGVGAHRHDLADEAARRAGGLGLQVRAQRIGVLLRAADAERRGKRLGGLDQRRAPRAPRRRRARSS